MSYINEGILLQSYSQTACQKLHKCGVHTLRQRQDGRHFAHNIFECIFLNENCSILIKISLKYVRKCPMDNNPAFVQKMAWGQTGDKPLFEPMMALFGDAYMHLLASMS